MLVIKNDITTKVVDSFFTVSAIPPEITSINKSSNLMSLFISVKNKYVIIKITAKIKLIGRSAYPLCEYITKLPEIRSDRHINKLIKL